MTFKDIKKLFERVEHLETLMGLFVLPIFSNSLKVSFGSRIEEKSSVFLSISSNILGESGRRFRKLNGSI